MEISAEQCRLVAPGASTDFNDAVAVVNGIAGQQHGQELCFEFANTMNEAGKLGASFGGHLGIIDGNELAHLRKLAFRFLKSSRRFDDRRESAVLSTKVGVLIRVAKAGRVGERPLYLVSAGEGGR